MTRYEIKTLSLGGILDQTAAVVKDHFWVLLGIAAIVYVPYGLINGAISMSLLPARPTGNFGGPEWQEYNEATVRVAMMTMPVSLIFGLAGFIANGAMVWAVAQAYLGEPVAFDSAWGQAFRRSLALIGTSILYSLAMFGGLLLCVIPGILVMIWFLFYAQTVMLDGLSGTAALKRSKALIKGNFGTAFVLMFLVGLISFVIGFVSAMVPQPHLQIVLQTVIQAVVLMFSAAAMTVFYFSARCQHEDFDLMRLAAAVEANDGDQDDNPYARQGAL
jgi:hypothetical protein